MILFLVPLGIFSQRASAHKIKQMRSYSDWFSFKLVAMEGIF